MAANINIKGTTNDNFRIGKGGTTLFQGAFQPDDAVDGDIWLDTGTYSPRVFTAEHQAFQLPLMDYLGFKDNMIASLSDPAFSTDESVEQIIGRNTDLSDIIDKIKKIANIIGADGELEEEDFTNNIVVKSAGLFGGLLLANDSSVARIKTSDSDSLSINAGNTVSETEEPGNLQLSPGKEIGGTRSGDLVLDGLVWPKEDGTSNQVLVTDGEGNLAFQDKEQINSATYIDFIPFQEKPEHNQGRLFYNNERDTLSYYNNIAGVEVNIGQEFFIPVNNSTETTITKGMAVASNNPTGGIIYVKPAQAIDRESARVMGLAQEDILPGENGLIVAMGLLDNIDTVTYNAGDVLFLSPDAPGGLTSTKPDEHVSGVGIVIENSSLGKIQVSIYNNLIDQLYKLIDVQLTNPIAGESLVYDGTSWVNLPNTHGEGAVDSVFSRTGNIQAENDDYQFDQTIAEPLSTSVIEGGYVYNTSDNAVVAVEEGRGIINRTTVYDQSSTSRVPWVYSEVTLLNLDNNGLNWILVNDLGGVYVTATEPTITELRENIPLAKVTSQNNKPPRIENISSIAGSLSRTITSFSQSLNFQSFGGELWLMPDNHIRLTSAVIYGSNVNYENDPSNPDVAVYPEENPLLFRYIDRDGNVGEPTTIVDGRYYDLVDVGITRVTDDSNSATIQYLYRTRTGEYYMGYGQQMYSSNSSADSVIVADYNARVIPSALGNADLIYAFALEEDMTDLSYSGDSKIFKTNNDLGIPTFSRILTVGASDVQWVDDGNVTTLEDKITDLGIQVETVNSNVGGVSYTFANESVIDASTHNYVKLSDDGSVLNIQYIPEGVYKLTLLVDIGVENVDFSGYTIKWEDGIVPTLTAYEDIITLVTFNQGTDWYGTFATGFR